MVLFPSINSAILQKFWIFCALNAQPWEVSTIPSCHLLSPHVLMESAYLYFEQISNALLFPCSLGFRVFKHLVIFTRIYKLLRRWGGSDRLGLSEPINSKKSFIWGSSSINIFKKFLWLSTECFKIKDVSMFLLFQILLLSKVYKLFMIKGIQERKSHFDHFCIMQWTSIAQFIAQWCFGNRTSHSYFLTSVNCWHLSFSFHFRCLVVVPQLNFSCLILFLKFLGFQVIRFY